jgi:short-subunit dehydrogenase
LLDPEASISHLGQIDILINNAGSVTPSPLFLPSGTTNAALLNFAKGLSKELAKVQKNLRR